VRRGPPHHPRGDEVPRAGDLGGHRAQTKADQDKPSIALQKLSEEDPTFRVHSDAETAQTIISGMGELHLEVLVERMRREFKVDANVGRPQVAYRERCASASNTWREVHPPDRRPRPIRARWSSTWSRRGRDGLRVRGQHRGWHDPREYIGPVEQGVKEALENGVLAGYPMVDVKVELVDGRTMTWIRAKWRSRSPGLWQ